MFSRAVQVKLVKPSKGGAEPTKKEGPDLEKISEIVGDQVFNVGVVVVGAITVVKVVDTACKIAVNLSNPLSWR